MSIRVLLASVLLMVSLAAYATPPLRILTEDKKSFAGRVSAMPLKCCRGFGRSI